MEKKHTQNQKEGNFHIMIYHFCNTVKEIDFTFCKKIPSK